MADRLSGKVVYLEHGKGAGSSLLEKVAYDHEPALRRFLRVRLSGHPDYEDLIHDTFVRLARQEDLAQKLSKGESSTRSYLFSIAANLVNDRHRQLATRQSHDEKLANGPSTHQFEASAEDHVAQREQLKLVRKALAGLNAESRDAFVLSRFEAMSYREIAERMNISVSMVEKHIIRALSAIRKKTRASTE